jgi:hypothetical protein
MKILHDKNQNIFNWLNWIVIFIPDISEIQLYYYHGVAANEIRRKSSIVR